MSRLARQALATPVPDVGAITEVRAPGLGSPWVALRSDEGQRIINAWTQSADAANLAIGAGSGQVRLVAPQ